MSAHSGMMLVVDDEPMNRILLATSLEEAGHTVETAENGVQALEALRTKPFDVVLLDLLMPKMDGFQVLEQMKADNTLQHIPVIVVSAHDKMESVVRCIEMGATDHLSKPFEPALLHARINASLATKRLHDQEREYFRNVSLLIDAAARVAGDIFDPATLALERMFTGLTTVAEQEKEARKKFIAQKVLDLRALLKFKQQQGVIFPNDTMFYTKGAHVTNPEIIKFIIELKPATELQDENFFHFLATIERERIERKRRWCELNSQFVQRKKDEHFMEWVRRVYLIENLEIPHEGMDTLQITDNLLITSYRNTCPILTACEFLQLDTRLICKYAFHEPHLELLKHLDPRLAYSRDYEKAMRPYQPYCIDKVTLLHEEDSMNNRSLPKYNVHDVFSIQSLNSGNGFIKAVEEMLTMYSLDVETPLVDDLILSLLQRVEDGQNSLIKSKIVNGYRLAMA